MATPKVIIIGGGFGGLTAAQSLKKADVNISLYDRTNHHLFQPLLYQVATSALSSSDIAQPIREILRNQENCTVLMGEVEKIDTKSKTIFLKNGDKDTYDYLILAIGGIHSYFGNDQWSEFAPGLKTLDDALSIRERVLMAFEKAERCESTLEALSYLNFVIIGGGPTGVEMAGAIAEIANKSMTKNFRKIRPQQAKIYLLEGAKYILPSYPPDLSLKAQKDLERLGVHVFTETIVTGITEEGVWIGNRLQPAHTVIWAAGNRGLPLAKTLNAPLDKMGRVLVEKDCSIPGDPNVFVIGDAANFPREEKDANGNLQTRPLPGVAQVAMQQGKFVAKIIERKTPPEARSAFKYFDKGQMATIGKGKAIATVGKLKMSGFLAWMAWSFIHIAYLVNFTNRFMVMAEWLFLFITGHRNVRLIIHTFDVLPEKKEAAETTPIVASHIESQTIKKT